MNQSSSLRPRWLLFGKSVKTINEHVKNIFKECELKPEPTIRKFRIVRTEGNREVAREIEHYNLDVIISVGYRAGFVPNRAPGFGSGRRPVYGSTWSRDSH
jgi:Virulence protein RhuM family